MTGMELLSFSLLLANLITIVCLEAREKSSFLQFPMLYSIVVLGFVTPQLFYIMLNEVTPNEGNVKFAIYVLLCNMSVYYGYKITKGPLLVNRRPLLYKRIIPASIFFSISGAYFFLLVTQNAAEVIALHGGLWTGRIVIYNFFASLLTLGFAIAVVSQVERPSLWNVVVIAFGASFILHRVIIQGRREDFIQLGIVILLFLYWRFRWVPSRSSMIVASFIAAAFVSSIGQYRSIMLSTDGSYGWSGAGLSQLAQIDFFDTLMTYYNSNMGSSEITNAVLEVDATDKLLNFDFGLSHWNQFVLYYIPAQFVGSGLKSSLLFELENNTRSVYHHLPSTGSTITGYADSFRSFWYFGCVIFGIIAVVMKKIFLAAETGNFAARVLLILIISRALMTVTHSTSTFFLEFVFIFVFFWPILAWASSSRGSLNIGLEARYVK